MVREQCPGMGLFLAKRLLETYNWDVIQAVTVAKTRYLDQWYVPPKPSR